MTWYLLVTPDNKIVGVYDYDPTQTITVRSKQVIPAVLNPDGSIKVPEVVVPAVTEDKLPLEGVTLQTLNQVDRPLEGGTYDGLTYTPPTIETLAHDKVGIYELPIGAQGSVVYTGPIGATYLVSAPGLQLDQGKVTFTNATVTITFTCRDRGLFLLDLVPVSDSPTTTPVRINVM